jgi:aspartate aminotransferase-like enzyme
LPSAPYSDLAASSGRAARAGAEALGLTLWARDPAIRSDTITALGRALRALGANADIGAAVEAAVSALEARP